MPQPRRVTIRIKRINALNACHIPNALNMSAIRAVVSSEGLPIVNTIPSCSIVFNPLDNVRFDELREETTILAPRVFFHLTVHHCFTFDALEEHSISY